MNIVLLTTPTCVKCKAVKEWLPEFCEQRGISLDTLNALDSKGRVLVDTYKLTQVPVIFLYDKIGNLVEIFKGDTYPETIEKFLSEPGNLSSITN